MMEPQWSHLTYTVTSNKAVPLPTIFGIFFTSHLKHAFDIITESFYLHTRLDGRLFNLACLKSKSKAQEALIRNILFVADAAVTTHTQEELQTLMNHFSEAFRLTMSLKKDRMWMCHQSSPLMTMSWKLGTSSCTLGL